MKKLFAIMLLLVIMTTTMVGCEKEDSPPPKDSQLSNSNGDKEPEPPKDSQLSDSNEDKEPESPKEITYVTTSDMEALGFELVYEGEDTHDYENEAGDYILFYPDGTLTGAFNIDGTAEFYDIIRDGIVGDVVVSRAIDIYEMSDSELPYYTIDDQNMELQFDSEGYVTSEREYTHSASQFNAGDYAGITFNEILEMHFGYLIVK